MHSPRITKVEIVRPGKVRRAKLYYLRDAVGKAKRIKTRVGGNIASALAERNARAEAAAAAQEAAIKEEQKEEHAAEAAEKAKKK